MPRQGAVAWLRVRVVTPVQAGATVVPDDAAAASAHGATVESEAKVVVPVRDAGRRK
jgi:hypothetical protein